jgi:hypothetical protein
MGFSWAEGEGKLRIGRLHFSGGSLAEVISSNPAWWTPTAKAKAVVGIALALRFSHGLGLLHGGLKAGNVLFDGGGRVQIADFRPMRRDGGFSGKREGKEWSPQADVSAFAMLLFEIVAGRPSPPPSAAQGDLLLPPDVPDFVWQIIKKGRRSAGRKLSFVAIVETLEMSDFRIVAAVDSDEVRAFVSRVESTA